MRMSGICGWIGGRKPLDPVDALHRMTEAFGHDAKVTTPERRGAVTAGGPRARIFRDGDIRVALIGRPSLNGNNDPDTVLAGITALFREQPNRLPADLHGPFCLAVIDVARDCALLAIDRLGVERLVYAEVDQGLVFSNRADSVAGHPHLSKTLEPQGVFDYLYFHCIPSPRVIFKGQQKLLPGQCIRYENGQVETEFYWAIQYEDHHGAYAPLKEEFLATLEASVRRAADAGEPGRTGSFLSGGTDSSTVSGLLTKVAGKPAKTFSIGFAEAGYDEMEYARIAERHFGLDAYSYYVTPEDVLSAIPRIAAAYDEPFGNASAVPALFCSELAVKNGVKTLLAGDGGDEIFGGNSRYVEQLIFELYGKLPQFLRKGLLEPLAFRLPGVERIYPLRKMRNYIRGYQTPLPDRMETYNFLHRTPLAEIFSGDFLAAIDQDEPIKIIREVYQRADTESVLHRMLHLDMKITLADNDLRKVSQMCELAGVDVQYPLLDEAFVEFSGRVPPHLKIKNFKLRHFFKKALQDVLPEAIINKKKHGFGLPTGIWLRDHPALRTHAHQKLEELKQRNIIKPGYVDEILKPNDQEHANYYGVMVWVMLMLEEWLQSQRL